MNIVVVCAISIVTMTVRALVDPSRRSQEPVASAGRIVSYPSRARALSHPGKRMSRRPGLQTRT